MRRVSPFQWDLVAFSFPLLSHSFLQTFDQATSENVKLKQMWLRRQSRRCEVIVPEITFSVCLGNICSHFPLTTLPDCPQNACQILNYESVHTDQHISVWTKLLKFVYGVFNIRKMHFPSPLLCYFFKNCFSLWKKNILKWTGFFLVSLFCLSWALYARTCLICLLSHFQSLYDVKLVKWELLK